MNETIKSLIEADRYQIFVMTCPASIPFSFAIHPWFVINKKGTLSRWGVGWQPEKYGAKIQWGHIGLNVIPPFQGLRIFYFSNKYSWKSSVFKVIEGDEKSTAAQMAEFIENSPHTYPFKDTYSFVGPNSNTYVEWVLNNFPELNIHLPWNAFGKGKAQQD